MPSGAASKVRGAPGANVTRVAVIGPVLPYRSGVARHTTALARALAELPGAQVKVYSFSRQYPQWLFPGDSDRMDSPGGDVAASAEFVVDALNPYNWFQVCHQIASWQPDLAIAPAWTFVLSPCFSSILSGLRRRGCRVVAIVHNVSDHDSSRWKWWISRLQLRQADAYVTHTRDLASGIRALVPGAPVAIHPHPVFSYPEASAGLPQRAELELLMFGLVRPYKGLDVLLEAVALSRHPSLRLTVVGEFWQDLEEARQVCRRLAIEHLVEIVPRFVSDEEAAEYFARADAVVLPYRTVTGSGVLPLAYHYEKPVIVSDLPGFVDLVQDGITGWVVPRADPRALAQTIDERVSREAASAMRGSLRSARDRLSWRPFAELVLEVGKAQPVV